MSKEIDCTQCKTLVDLNAQPVLCHICPMGHVLCEECNDVARYYCFQCGGKTERKVPDKELKELFKVQPDVFMKKLLNSSTLIVPEENKAGEATSDNSVTVIGYKKWPRTFFHKIPEDKSVLQYNQQFLQMMQNIVEDESPFIKPTHAICWDLLPRSFRDFEMSYDIMKCPITRCRYPICNCDTTRHLLQSHEDIPIEILPRNNIGNFSVNILCRKKNEIRALLRILVPGIIKDLGFTKHKDCLPLYLLCTKVNILEAEENLSQTSNAIDAFDISVSGPLGLPPLETNDGKENVALVPWKDSDCVLIWCAGIVPLDYPISVAISVFASGEMFMNVGALLKVFSLHLPQDAHEIYKSTERLMIAKADLIRLTKISSVFNGQISIM